MSWPIVEIVDAPSPDATVRFAVNVRDDDIAPRGVHRDGFTLGVPTLEGDPLGVGVSWGTRAPSFTHTISGSKTAALEALSKLSRELLRPVNWVHWRLSQSTPSFWTKIYRSSYQPLSLDNVYVETDDGEETLLTDVWEIQVPLLADPFLYGARETMPALTFTQSPTGMSAALPAIKGDAPAPLRVQVKQLGNKAAYGYGSRWLLGSVGASTPTSAIVVDIGSSDGFTAKTGTAAGTPDSDYFGGSYRAVAIAAGSNYVDRLTGTLTVPSGRYKVLLRATAIRPDVHHTLSFLFGFGQFPDLNTTFKPFYGPTASQSVGSDLVGSTFVDTFMGCVDLGDFTFPFGTTALPDDVGLGAQANAFVLRVGTADQSAGTVHLDALILLPLDGPNVESCTVLQAAYGNALTAKYVVPLTAGTIATFDGNDETTWLTDANVAKLFAGGPALIGGYPRVDPALDSNVLHVIAMDNGLISGTEADWTTSVGAQTEVVASYHPLYLQPPGSLV